MASRYSVNDNKPPFFTNLTDARAYSVSLTDHMELGREEDDIQWKDDVFRDKTYVGTVLRVKDTKAMCGLGTMYRWVVCDDDGKVSITPMYADGTLVPIPKGTVEVSTVPRPGYFGIGNRDETVWLSGGLKAVLKYAMDSLKREPEVLADGQAVVLFHIWDDDQNKTGYVVQLSNGTIVYGCADRDWYAVKDNGTLGKKVRVCGGPYLDGHADSFGRDGPPDALVKELDKVKEMLMQKLPPKEYEQVMRDLDIETMMNRTTEERTAFLEELMCLVSENNRRGKKRR